MEANRFSWENTLQVEVTDVSVNRLRDMDINGVVWYKFYDMNLAKIDYEPFDALGWEIRDAWLLGPVTLKQLRFDTALHEQNCGNMVAYEG